MGRDKVLLLPPSQRILRKLEENIKLARLRRKLSSAMVAQRANISRPTVLAIETGSAVEAGDLNKKAGDIFQGIVNAWDKFSDWVKSIIDDNK